MIKVGEIVRVLPSDDEWDNVIGRVADYYNGAYYVLPPPGFVPAGKPSHLRVQCEDSDIRRLSALEQLALLET